MKKLYFIRHGESKGNASIFEQQNEHTVLTAKGQEQARTVAEHLKKLPIEAIISSPYERTKATAEELSQELGIPVDTSELFVEHRRPGVQLRKKKLHPYWLAAELMLSLHRRKDLYRHSDEETVTELLGRAEAALTYILSRPEESIAVFTHGRFMRALYARMTLGDTVTSHAYLGFTRTLRMRNTAIMAVTLENDSWEVTGWDLHAKDI